MIAAMFDSILVYIGLTLTGAGLMSLVLPLRFLWIRTRPRGALVALGGILVMAVGLAWPATEKRASVRTTKLDEWMPVWQFDERHVIHIDAPPDRAFTAIHTVRASEITLFRTLTAIRRFGRPGPESILNAPEQKPLLDVATRTTFIYLTDEAPRELVVGTVIAAPSSLRRARHLTPDVFRQTLPPGVVLATMNFLVTADPRGRSDVSTETRVYANNASTMRRFAVYWRLIHPGSDIIRRMWLRAIKRRAEGTATVS
jgi:hypothetical protein